MNGFMHGSQGRQAHPNQEEILSSSAVNDRHNLMQRGLPSVESQQANALDCASVPVGFDFLGGHQQLLRSQPGLAHPHPMQQPGYSDMQLLQQQLMYRQLHEIQRQKQLQHLGQGGRLHGQFNQFSGAEEQFNGVQLPSMLNGLPIQDLPNRTWSNQLMAGEIKTQGTSQILATGNMNWVQPGGLPSIPCFPNGLMLAHDGGAAMRSMANVPQQSDQLYGTPVISSRGSLNYSQFQSLPFDCTNGVNKVAGEQEEKADALDFQTEAFPGKKYFGNVSGSFQQVDELSLSVQRQEFQGRKGQTEWSANLPQKAENHKGVAHGVTNLDSSEEKILFGTDDDSNWDCNPNAGSYPHGNELEGNDCFGGFPSMQSGSWSALMQEALGASSSNAGVQEEWNGFSVVKAGMQSGHAFDGSRSQQIRCDDKNMQDTSPLISTAFPSFRVSGKSSNCNNAPGSQQPPVKFMFEQDGRIQNDTSSESCQQQLTETNSEDIGQGGQHKQSMWNNLPGQVNPASSAGSAWMSQMHRQSINNATNMGFNPQSVQGIRAQQAKAPLQSINVPSGKQTGWHMNETVSSSGLSALKVHDISGERENVQISDMKMTAPIGNDLSPVENVNSKNVFQEEVGRQQVKGRPMGLIQEEDHIGVAQTFDSSLNNMDKGSSEAHGNRHGKIYQKEVQNEEYIHNHLHAGPQRGKHSILPGEQLHDLSSCNQTMPCLPGHKTLAPRKFQFHPMGNVTANAESIHAQNHAQYSQGLPQLFGQGVKNHKQACLKPPQTIDSSTTNNVLDAEKKDARGAHANQSTPAIQFHDSATSSSFDNYDQNRRFAKPSRHMLELLHKVDQSRKSNIHMQFGHSNRMASSTTVADQSDRAASQPRVNQSSTLQVSLGLAPPAQLPPGSSYASPLPTSLQTAGESGSSSRKGNLEDVEKVHTSLLALAHEEAQTDEPHDSSGICGGESQSNNQMIPKIGAPNFPLSRNQHQQEFQHIPRVKGMPMTSHHVNLSGNQIDANEQIKQAAFLKQTQESHARSISDQSVHASLPATSGGFSSRLSSAVSDSRVGPPLHLLNAGLSRPVNSIASHLRGTSNHRPSIDSRLVSESGTPQLGGYSTMVQNALTNISGQRQLSSGQPFKINPHMCNSISQLASGRTSNPWNLSKVDSEGNKGLNTPSDIGTSPENSQQVAADESRSIGNSLQPPDCLDAVQNASGALHRHMLSPKQPSDGNSVVALPPLVRRQQQELSRGKNAHDLSTGSQLENSSMLHGPSSSHGVSPYGGNMKPSSLQTQSYSLLQQMRTMKGGDSDLSNVVGKRPREDSDCDASQMDWKISQKFIYPQNSVCGQPMDNKLGAASQQPGMKYLSFTSRENEERNSSSSRDLPQEPLAYAQHDFNPLNPTSSSTSVGASERPFISPQMAPSWFNQYAPYKNGEILAMYDGFGSSQLSKKTAEQHFIFRKTSDNKLNNFISEEKSDAVHDGSACQSPSLIIAPSSPTPVHNLSEDTENNIIMIPKKRRSLTSGFLPWHKEVEQGSAVLRSVGISQREWAQVGHVLVEKLEDEIDAMEDALIVPRARRRLVLTTQLIQQVLPAAPSMVLRESAISYNINVTYISAKLLLGDACSMICHAERDFRSLLSDDELVSKRLKILERRGEEIYLKATQTFVERSKKQEIDMLSLDRRSSMLDLRIECQDLERCSIINRFAKFHGRSQADGAETLTSESVYRRIIPQNQTIAVPMPINLLEGASCISL